MDPAHGLEVRLTGLVLQDPVGRELAGLDVPEPLGHGLLHVVGDDLRARVVVAELGGVADRIAHLGHAALVHEVDDELELVEALEVGDLGLVAGLDQGVERGLDQVGHAAAEHDLLAEEVGLGLLLERGLDDAGARAADARGPRQRQLHRLTGRVLVHRDHVRHAGPFREDAAHHVAGALRGDHDHVDVGRRDDLVEVDVEAVRPRERLARGHRLVDLRVVDVRGQLVGDEHHHDVGLLRRLARGHDSQAVGLDLLPSRRVRAQADPDVAARVVEVQRVRVTLTAVADDRDLARAQQIEVAILLVEDVCHDFLIAPSDVACR